MESKPWYLSKTLWVNVLMFVLAIVQSDLVTSANFVSAEVIAAIITGVNFLLRLITSSTLTATKPK